MDLPKLIQDPTKLMENIGELTKVLEPVMAFFEILPPITVIRGLKVKTKNENNEEIVKEYALAILIEAIPTKQGAK